MALSGNGAQFLCNVPNRTPYTPLQRPSPRIVLFPVCANPKKQSSSSSSKTGKFDSKNRRTVPLTTKDEVEWKGVMTKESVAEEEWTRITQITVDDSEEFGQDGSPMPILPGAEPDFWEGPQWEAFGFFVQYLWAFGILFAIISAVIAATTFNEGATDFKETPAYKESIQSRELLEVPDAPNADVFESNPTEEAPSLE